LVSYREIPEYVCETMSTGFSNKGVDMIKTTATNKKIWELLKDKTLIPTPAFQRRLVWTDKDKQGFLDTVLKGYPFPEIYVATGEVDLTTGQGIDLLVDGQQRITTLNQYFTASEQIRLGKDILPYAKLSDNMKRHFLAYDVVVRNLGQLSSEEIKEIFKRINATGYSLNAMEVHNSRYDGEFKKFAEEIAGLPFFDDHKIFSNEEVKRMRDTNFILTFIITIMSAYFTRDDEVENFLEEYNDEFPLKDELHGEIHHVLKFIEKCDFDRNSRAWKKSDFLTLLVEIDRALIKKKLQLDPKHVGENLKTFYNRVDVYAGSSKSEDVDTEIRDYHKATLQGTNDRGSRIKRGQIIQKIIDKKMQ
jgi:RNA binding exosome subunit